MNMEPGFYQGKQKGLASGRVSPRDAIRPRRADAVNAAHGIISQGQADPNHGQLFDTRQMPSRSANEIVGSHGIPPALAGGGHAGFMPALQRSTPERTRQAKATAVTALGTARSRSGSSRGGPPVKETMEDRASTYARSSHAPWYADASTPGTLGEGDSSRLIADSSSRLGVSHARMTRAVAITSPRTGWDNENGPLSRDGGIDRPNLRSAESVVEITKGLPHDTEHSVVKEIGAGSYGKSLNDMKGKAAVEFHKGEPKSPIPIGDPSSQKVPNFEQSLHLDHPSSTVRAQAARSYTVDVHDTTSMGADEQLLKSDTGYAVAAMTGRRAALKAGELPPNYQARTWNVVRGEAAPDSLGDHRLFVSARGGKLKPNPVAMPEHEAAFQRAVDHHENRYKSTGERLGMEF